MRRWVCVLTGAMLAGLNWPGPAFANFLDDFSGARPAGLAGAFVGLADDANAPFSNPAGLARLPCGEIAGMYSDLYSGLNSGLYNGQTDRLGNHLAAAALPLGNQAGSVELAWTQFDSTFYQENIFLLSYGRHLWPEYALDAGISLKGLQWKLAANDYTAAFPVLEKFGWSGSAGLLASPWPNISLGFSLDNVVPLDMGMTQPETVPLVVRLGGSYRLPVTFPSLSGITAALEVDHRAGIYTPKLGAESWWFQKLLALRVGVNADQATAGLSLRYAIPGNQLAFRLDYAFAYPFYMLDTWGSHRVGLSLCWEGNSFARKIPAATVNQAYQAEQEYQEYTHFKQFLEFKKKEAEKAANIAQIAQESAEQEARKAQQAAELAQAANFSINRKEEIVIGFEKNMLQDFAAIQDSLPWVEAVFAYLMKQTGLKLIRKEYNSGGDLEADFRAGEIDLILCRSEIFSRLHAQGLIMPLATTIIQGKDSQRYCLLVRDDKQIAGLEDLHSKRLGYFSPDDLKQMQMFFKNDETHRTETFFSELQSLAHPLDSLVALQMKDVDAVLGTEYLVCVYGRIKEQMTGRIKVLAWSSEYAFCPAPISGRCLMRPEKMREIERLLKALAKMHKDEEGRRLLAVFQLDRFKRMAK
jgi:ABC-type phosphate/phosphonate transport system substrate-binding protein